MKVYKLDLPGEYNIRGDGPFQVLKRINDNAYKLDFPSEYNISATFNVSDLSPFDVSGRILLKKGGMMRITKHSRIHCMFQLGLLLKQDPRRSKKHLMG